MSPFAALENPYFRCGLVAATNLIPLIALGHLIFFEGMSLWRVVVTFFMTIINSGTNMTVTLHRYFSHRAFEVGRFTQFMLGWISCLAYQQGPLWWASKHRRHHSTCDTPDDPHSWSVAADHYGSSWYGFFYSWLGWTMDPKEAHIDSNYLGSLVRYPELWAVERLWFLPPFALTYVLHNSLGVHPAYPLVSMLACRLITLHFNCVFHPPEGEFLAPLVSKPRGCRSIDLCRGAVDFMADAVGESHHDDHHTHPSRAKRPGIDYSFRFVIRPMVAVGLAWAPKNMWVGERSDTMQMPLAPAPAPPVDVKPLKAS